MAYKMKGFGGFGNSPAKTKGHGMDDHSHYHLGSGKSKKIVKKGDMGTPGKVHKAYETLDVSKQKKKSISKSPAKQEGPIPKKNIKLQKGEMEGTWLYEGDDKRERIVDLEDRAGFLTENDIPDTDDPKRKAQLIKTAKKLQHEADILRNRKTK